VASTQLAGKVRIIGVAWNGSEQSMQEFVSKHQLTFANIKDNDGLVFAQFDVAYQPAWVFIQQDGTSETNLGAMDEVTLSKMLEKLGGS
jgi:peroxiredoxin